MTKTNQEIVEMATAKVGGESALARALGIKVQSVQKWKKIPAERVPAVEHVTGIPREQLRPDLYGAWTPPLPPGRKQRRSK